MVPDLAVAPLRTARARAEDRVLAALERPEPRLRALLRARLAGRPATGPDLGRLDPETIRGIAGRLYDPGAAHVVLVGDQVLFGNQAHVGSSGDFAAEVQKVVTDERFDARFPRKQAIADARPRELLTMRYEDLVDDPLSFRFGWEWPTREQWRAGQRHGYCWAPD